MRSSLTSRLLVCLLVCVGSTAFAQTRIRGTVIDTEGQPVEGAVVHGTRLRPPGTPPFSSALFESTQAELLTARTDARGRFVLELPRPEAIAVHASMPGAAQRSVTVQPTAPGAVVTLQLHELLRVRGRIVVRGLDQREGLEIRSFATRSPRQGLQITDPSRRAFAGPPVDTVRTTKAGDFEIRVPRAGRRQIECPALNQRVWLAEGEIEMPVEIRARWSTRTARVLDEATGKPIAGVRIGWGAGDTAVPRHVAVTDAEGRFRCAVPGDPYLYCVGEGVQPELALASSEEIRLSPHPKNVVRLLDAAGAPLPNAKLIAVHWTNGPFAGGPIAVPLRTGDDGHCSFVGKYPVSVYLRGPDSLSWLGNVTPRLRVEPYTLSTALNDVQGTVLDIDGLPAAHASVYVMPKQAPKAQRLGLSREAATYTDRSGRFHLRLPAGDHLICTRTERSKPCVLEYHASPDSPAPTLRLAPAALVEGTLLGPDKEPLPHTLLGLHSLDPEWNSPWLGSRGLYLRTDAKGRFSLPASSALKHALTVWREGARTPNQCLLVTPPATDLLFELVDEKR